MDLFTTCLRQWSLRCLGSNKKWYWCCRTTGTRKEIECRVHAEANFCVVLLKRVWPQYNICLFYRKEEQMNGSDCSRNCVWMTADSRGTWGPPVASWMPGPVSSDFPSQHWLVLGSNVNKFVMQMGLNLRTSRCVISQFTGSRPFVWPGTSFKTICMYLRLYTVCMYIQSHGVRKMYFAFDGNATFKVLFLGFCFCYVLTVCMNCSLLSSGGEIASNIIPLFVKSCFAISITSIADAVPIEKRRKHLERITPKMSFPLQNTI